MIRRWIRALERTWPVRPFPAPPPVGRRRRTLLRLEAVEDRTLASVTAVEPPELVPAATEAHADSTTPPTKPKSDDQSDAGSSPSDHQTSVTASAAADMPVMMAGGGWNTWVGDAPVPSVNRHEVVLSAQFNSALGTADESAASPKPTPARTEAGEHDAPAATGLDAASQPTAGPAQAPTAGATASPSAGVTASPPSSPSPGDSTVTTNSTTPRAVRSGEADGPVARLRQVNSDPVGPRVNVTRSVRADGTVARTPNARPTAELSDGALLQRFVTDRDQTAFSALVQRHGRLVLNVCQRVLGDFHAAQDASQATFMILARKAGMLDRSTPLGGWLYKVAYHLALRSRAVTAKQRLGERQAANEFDAPAAEASTPDLDQRELHQVVREELAGLPEKYRAPLTLCYLDGRSHAEAAREIGLPRGSMAKRVGEGLEYLRERLLHRGLVL
jgi:RNA polymerase sigma factor (sigma-70 family)